MDKRKEKNKIRYLCAISIAVPLILLGFTGPANCWNHEFTHKEHLTWMALKLLEETTKNQEYSPEIWEEFAEFIKYGARDEDMPCKFLQLHEDIRRFVTPDLIGSTIGFAARLVTHDLRANNHYGHAIARDVGLTYSALGLGDPDTAPVNWAKTNSIDWLNMNPTDWVKRNGSFSFDEEFGEGRDWWRGGEKYNWSAKDLDNGNMSWKNAIDRYGYTTDSKALAYYTLGFVLHLLEDMGEPEHVHDDPHGGSSFTGFERYMEDNWDKGDMNNPDIKRLRPWRPSREPDELVIFPDIDGYFDRLGKIAYSAVRFKGYKDGGDPKKIEKGSDLERMFDLEETDYVWSIDHSGARARQERGWFLKNKEQSMVRYLKYMPQSYGKDPAGHKGRDEGEWWPTYRELENIGKANVDAPGYYYIELSDDLPPFGERKLYPMAYLPSPLPEVEEECHGWRKETLKTKTHLYEILAKNLAPRVVEYAAGLIQHYFEIVNHPPYVERVDVKGRDGGYYEAFWYTGWADPPPDGLNNKDYCDVREGTDSIRDVKKREFLFVESDLGPGETSITITFSEPVKDVKVRIQGKEIKGLKPDSKNTVWEGTFEIPEKGPESEELRISIEARDLNPHFRNEGDQLDRDPSTPAKRRVHGYDGYIWGETYQPGGDENHSFRVVRKEEESSQLTEPTSDQGNCADIIELREGYKRKCDEMRDDFAKLNCEPPPGQKFGYPDCANHPRGCFYQIITDALPCPGSQVRISCGTKLVDNYYQCQKICNGDLVARKLNIFTIKGCGDDCDADAKAALEACKAGAIDPPNKPRLVTLPTGGLPGSRSTSSSGRGLRQICGWI